MPKRTITVAKRPHITFSCVNLRYGGSERVMLEYIASLAELSVDISVVFQEYPSERLLENELRVRNPNIRHVVHLERSLDAGLWLLKQRPDLLVIVWPTRRMLKALQRLRRFRLGPRVIGILHEHYDYHLREYLPVAKLVESWVLCWDFRERVRALLGPQEAYVIHPLFSAYWGCARTRLSCEDVRDRLGIPREAFLIGYLGRLDHHKELDRLIALAEMLQSRLAFPVHVLIAGLPREGVLEMLHDVRERSPLRDMIHLLGAQPELSDLLPALDLHVMTSRQEGFLPFSTLHAMEQGVPVATTTVGGSLQALGGQPGVLIIYKEDDQLSVTDQALQNAADKIAQTFRDPGARNRLGLMAAALAQKLTCNADNHRTVRIFFQELLNATK
ncbi:MAG: glycosyltransferase family 4 protein [Geobacteraceae bacterium]|nr:glycosyltransferase family 4 protein [Geobacteraceae bacterium]